MVKEKYKQFLKKMAENTNRLYSIFVTSFCMLMVVFMTSKMWLPSDVKIQNTDTGSVKSITASTSLTLDDWQYNREVGYMEVSFTVKNADDAQEVQFIPTAHTNANKTTLLNASVAYSSNDLLTIQIKNVPRKWEVVSLWIRSTNAETDSDPVSSASDDTLTGANFLCDIRKVKINNTLQPQSSLNYALLSIYNQIKEIKSDIAEAKKNIASTNTEIAQLNFDISSLSADQKYQTQDDIQKSNSIIQSKKSRIDDLKNALLNYQMEIKNDQDKIKKLNQKMDDTKRGKLSPVLGSSSVALSGHTNSSSAPASKKPREKVSVD